MSSRFDSWFSDFVAQHNLPVTGRAGEAPTTFEYEVAQLPCAEHEMRDAGIEAARLVSSKTAQDYYLKQGWEIDGERVVCYTTDGQPMRKQLISSNT